MLVKPLRQGHRDRQGQFPRLGDSGDQDGSQPRLFNQGQGQQQGRGGFQFRGPQLQGQFSFRGNTPKAFGNLQERFGELQERFGRFQDETRQRFQGDAPRRGDRSENTTPASSQVEPAPAGSTNL